MDNCVASSQGLEICTQEKSIITLTNGGGGATSKPNAEKKKRKQERETWRTLYKAVFFFNGVHQ